MSRRARSYARLDKTRKLLRRIEPEVTANLRIAIAAGASEVEAEAHRSLQALDHVQTGDLEASIGATISRDGFSAIVGPGARGAQIIKNKGGRSAFGAHKLKLSNVAKHHVFQMIKGYWLEYGTKGGAYRRGGRVYAIPPQPPSPWLSMAYNKAQPRLAETIKRLLNQALKTAAGGL